MFKIIISDHKDFYNYLRQKRIPLKEQEFTFLHLEHFLNLTSSYITNYIILSEIDRMLRDELIYEVEKAEYINLFDSSFKKEIEYYILNMLSSNKIDKTQFSIDHFISFFLKDIKSQIRHTLLESINYTYFNNQEISLGEEKADVLYMVVEPNGSVTLEKKDCSLISSHPYHQQEQCVAEVLFINPTLLIVYDSSHLLKYEMTICLKKMLRKKVVFLEEEHPLRKNR